MSLQHGFSAAGILAALSAGAALYLTGAAPAAQAATGSPLAQAATGSPLAQAEAESPPAAPPATADALARAAAREPAAGEVPRIRFDTPSGQPVPRMLSLKTDETNCRAGPGFSYPLRVTFLRRGLPVMVVAETRDHWRKIRAPDGDECWTHKVKLSGAGTVLVLAEGLPLRARPDAAAPVRAKLGRGVIARVDGARDGWLKLSTDGLKGWARADALWGAQADSPLGPPNAAAHN